VTTVLLWAAPFLALGAAAAIAWSILAGHQIRCLPRVIAFRATRAALRVLIAARSAVIRARWAWRCHGRPPVKEDGELLTFEETRILGNLAAGRDVTGRRT
jgi:hypothetical protein